MVKKLSAGRFTGAVYRDEGEGFPVVLIHGFPMDGSLWNLQRKTLEKHGRLLIPDLPGSGDSPLVMPLSISEMADFIHAILIQEKIARCILIGHSMGGYITLAFAEKYSAMLQGFGLFHATASADSTEKKQSRLKAMALMQQYGAAAFLKQMMPGMFAGKFRNEQKETMEATIRARSRSDVHALEAYYQAMMERPDRKAVLEETKVPVLFVLGKEDTAAPIKDGLRQALLPKTCNLHILADVAHLGMLEAPEMAGHIMADFVRFCVCYPFRSPKSSK